jgi:hypothetical protein
MHFFQSRALLDEHNASKDVITNMARHLQCCFGASHRRDSLIQKIRSAMMKIKNVLQIASAAVLVAGFSIPGFAQNADDPDTMEKPKFESLDKNADGAISKTEAAASWLEASFARVDANRDGSVSKTEYDQAAS